MTLNESPGLGDQILSALARYPDRTAFAWDGGAMTYRAALDLIGRAQRVLLELDLPVGSTVAMLSANRADAWCVYAAALMSRLNTTWLHPQGSLADHLVQLDDCAASVLVVDTDTFADRGAELDAAAASLQVTFALGPAVIGRNLHAVAQAAGAATPSSLSRFDDPATLAYTGGTSGRPKGVLRYHREMAHYASSTIVNFHLPVRPNYLAVGPISHVAGIKIIPTLTLGGTVHLARKFDPEQVLSTIERERINFALFVPTMIYTLLDHPALSSTDTSSLELLLYGASPIAPGRLAEAIDRFGPVFAQLYGQTECYPISVLPREDHDLGRPELLASCGYPAIGCTVRLLGEDLREVAPGEPGEICVRAPQVLSEYWRRPEQTAEALAGGWLHTGDIARADDRGYLYILDRKKDMIVSGGFNVFPREVEDILSEHADVAMVAVIGVPHEKWGEAVTALVVPRPGAQVDGRQLIDLVKQRKGSIHAPKYVEVVADLPRTPVGKIDKKAVKARYWQGTDRMIG
ncbi:AMP-binding protein [Nocardia sp. R7R-8]|uniref:AMP-binding protein n=1 Tax=Nocardia sp. R7R-8 TaxID=3459304 RepID=UPI00403D57A5